MNEPEARAAHTAARAVALTELRAAQSGWQRAAEVAGLFAIGLLVAAGVVRW